MSPDRPLSIVAARALHAVAFAAALSCGAVAWASPPSAGLMAADLGGVPTSPGFKMDMNKSKTGAPELTAIGATPIELKASAAAARASEAAEAVARHGKPGDKPMGKVDGKAIPKLADKSATAASAADADMDPMDLLRQKLAAKLGASSNPNGSKYALRISNRGESGENVVTAVHSGVAARRTMARRAARPASASGNPDANANIAAYGGQSMLPTHWDYAGAGGPDAWSKLQPGFDKCATGTRQSPIDIRGGIAVDLEPIKFDYKPSKFSVVDNGHTVQVNVEPGNFITITGKRYELVQFHFHRPSEERINGRQFDMVAHLVHKDADGRQAVVAVLLDRGSAQAIVQAVWNNLPLEKGDEVKADTRIDLSQLLPEDKGYYTYMGSLTTPPCSEGVLWMVMKQPVPISPEQLAIFARLYPMNARPIQQADGRLIKESN